MESNKKYWKGLEELQRTPEFAEINKNEFAEDLPLEDVLSESGLNTVTPRRDFLKALGFGLGAVSLAACQTAPVHKSIPYLIKPEEVTPGVPNYYVSSHNGQSILVKTREGRPIKIEGNASGLYGNHGTDATTQASVLDLYDISKLKGPKLDNAETTWDKIDSFVKGELNKVQASGKKIRIISSTVNSPSTRSVIADFIAQYPNTTHIQTDAVSYAGIIQANGSSFGKAVLPRYRFDRADIIVSFGADFLGTWIAGEEFTKQYVSNRNTASLKKGKMSRHIQFETGMSMTGTNADSRIPVKPSETGSAIIALYNAITGSQLAGGQLPNNAIADKAVKLAAKELQNARGRALVVSGSNDAAVQTLVNAINSALGSYGATIDLDNPFYTNTGSDASFASLIAEMNRGEVGAVFILNSNPAYTYFNSKAFTDSLAKVPLRISFSDKEDETASLCNVIAPNTYYLESWGDENVFEGYYTLIQPAINPVFNSRQAEQSLLIWSDNPQKNYHQYVRAYWEKNLLPAGGKTWKQLLQTGFVYTGEKPATSYAFAGNAVAAAQSVVNQSKSLAKDIEVQLYQSVAIRDGKHANNAFLQELPDPVSKVTWDNYVAVSPKFAQEQGWEEFDLVDVKGANGYSITLPVLLQPGQAKGTVSIAVGYGRTKAGKAGNEVGKNAYPLAALTNGTVQFDTTATISKTGGKMELAQTQTHHSYEGRNVIRETSFKKYLADPHSGTGNHQGEHKTYDLWPEHKAIGHSWVMAIDLNACTGCGSCVVACNVENNIPVVGKDEVRRRREMHWIRIDRYYSFNEGGESVTEEKEIEKLENLDDVSVVHQPMLCQHCDHAPCETVCPVIATMHSSDGLNHMAYNRCVGTRYCANNCPYKVRRFNWFNYWNDSRFDNYLNNEFSQLLLNPDVTTRSRGVMEKCTLCIQRIQGGRLQAKMEKRPLKDGEIMVACQQACTAGAIIFGDFNDPNSAVRKSLDNERTYYVLQELNTQPGVGYQTKVRNTVEA
ncbi:TAT-variant-translocated molybdopterin oxidoreductase [Arcticibacter tournemirensis]|uniref:4Fe-4S dicluster domain-containing protein n=1 Tax=Arcticibacter tournemirensis TaxID=699437 RepID=A0A4Q0M3R3_9SPHI|nr:TAT-variant-translocated molybdopterin oxidoreductase [Arcticibacter tournemirensis]RXF67514.1 4Fe-4S dicluster domain-containing protein [Arcticibacter tournemirensis]